MSQGEPPKTAPDVHAKLFMRNHACALVAAFDQGPNLSHTAARTRRACTAGYVHCKDGRGPHGTCSDRPSL